MDASRRRLARLNGRHVGLLFEKPSLRTRVTFTIGVRELGGDVVEIPADVMHADREPIHDVARNLERWVDAVVIRTFAQERLVHIAEVTPRLHVINALTNEEHPCQALADMQTLVEQWGSLEGRRIAFVGDGNNVCASLVHASMMLGIGVHVATPKGYELPDEVVEQAAAVSQKGAGLTEFTDPKAAVRDVDAVYTDVWTSMGQEVEYADRKKTFTPLPGERGLDGDSPSPVRSSCTACRLTAEKRSATRSSSRRRRSCSIRRRTACTRRRRSSCKCSLSERST